MADMRQDLSVGGIKLTEEAIRLRSYQIWEREGRPEGCAAEHWQRAKAELEAELEEASMAGMAADIVLPRLSISKPPQRIVSGRIEDAAEDVAGASDKAA